MRRITVKILYLALLMGLSSLGTAQPKPASINYAYQYSPEAEISLSHILSLNNDTLLLHMQMALHQGKTNLEDYIFHFFQLNNEKTQAITFTDSSYINRNQHQHFLRFSFESVSLPEALIVAVMSKFSGFTYYHQIPLHPEPLILKDNEGTPVINTWTPSGVYKLEGNPDIFSYHYSHIFPPALPPMPVKQTLPEKSMAIDTSFVFQQDHPISLNKPGLYLFQGDSSSNKGLGLRVENKYFPKLTKLEELVEPLIYITTKEENNKLQSIHDNKREFDRFWLDLTKSPERAKSIIKNYFDRVEQANTFFTTYKEGWKTDMGMIYIIFGPPDEVNKTIHGETWTYLATTQLPKLNFSFTRTTNIFSNTHYVLKREKKYANPWFTAIDLWRKGRF